MRMRSVGFAAAIILCTAALVLADGSGYRLLITYKLGGPGRWDYLTIDSHARRLYIPRENHVAVHDVDSGKHIGDIANTSGVRAVALAADLGRGFTSNADEGTVTMFDLTTLATNKKIKVGKFPATILYDPATKRVFAFNARGQDATVIDASSGNVIGTVKLEGKPEFAASDEKGKIFVNVQGTNQIVAIDAEKLEVKARWPLAPCVFPRGLSMDVKNRRLFVGCDNNMLGVVDADSGKVIDTEEIGEDVGATMFDSEAGLVFASCADGSLTVIREDPPDHFAVIDTIRTVQGARTMALDPITHRVFLAAAQYGQSPDAKADDERQNQILPDSFSLLVVGK